MKNKIRNGLLCVLVLVLMGVGILVAVQWPRPEVVEMGTPITLSVEENEKTSGIFNYYRTLGWTEGSCEFELTGAEVYPSPEEAGIQEKNLSSSTTILVGEDIEFLLLKIRVKNIDAKNIDDGNHSLDFTIGFLSLLREDYFSGLGVFNTDAGIDHGMVSQEYDPNMAYFSGHAVMQQGDRSDPYFHFTLKPGETAEYEIGFFAKKDFIDNNQMVLSYAINKYASKIEVAK